MKTKVCLSLMLLMISMFLCVPHTNADYEQDTQLNLPEGAKARLGKGDVTASAYSLDYTRFAVANSIGIWIYDVRAGKEIASLGDTTDTLAFSPDGAMLAGASVDGAVRLWDVASGTLKATLEGHTAEVHRLVFSPDGATLASGGYDGAVRLWDVASGTSKATLKGHIGIVESMAFSPDGTTLAGGANIFATVFFQLESGLLADLEDEGEELVDTVWLWDIATGTLKHTLKTDVELGGWLVYSVAFSPDGTTLVSESWDETSGTTARLWDVSTGTLKHTLKTDTGIFFRVVFSPDGTTLANVFNNGSVGLWDVSTGTLKNTLKADTGFVWRVAFNPDGTTLAGESWDDTLGATVRLWDVATGTLKATQKGSIIFSPDRTTYVGVSDDNSIEALDDSLFEDDIGAIYSVAFSPDGATLATADLYNTVHLWDITTCTRKATLEGHTDDIHIVIFSPDGATLATASGNSSGIDTDVRLWDVASGTRKATLKEHTSRILSVAFSPDGATLATASWDDTVHLWDVASGALKATPKHMQGYSVAFSPDGTTLASGGDDGAVRLWDVASGTLIATIKEHEDILIVPDVYSVNAVLRVAFSPDGTTLASGYENGDVLLWDVASGTLKATHKEHTDRVHIVVFSPDSTTLATASWDGTLHLWDVASGTLKATIEEYTSRNNTALFSLNSLVFSSDGTTLATAYWDDTVRLWDVASGTLTATLKGHTGMVRSVALSPDGATLASGSNDGTVLLWEFTPTTQPVVQPQRVADVNGDGEVNIQDLVLVASRFGETGENAADVNGDGEVNIQDLVLVAGAFGDAAAAPAAHTLSLLTPETVQKWLAAAEQIGFTDAVSRRGIAVLEHLLATLIPKETALLANYPNPFNPETWIPYQLAKPADVTLMIYAANGAIVRTLALGHQSVGMYQSRSRAAYWDGNNTLGEPVASGVYFYTLTAGDFSATRKMLIRK